APAAAEPGPVVESKTEDAPVAEGVEGSPAPASQGKKKKRRGGKKKKKSGDAATAAAAAGSGGDFKVGEPSLKAPHRGVKGFTDYYVKYGQTEPPTIP
ncbi:unnamed protein product, partial [Symbiodinium sp. KB8]